MSSTSTQTGKGLFATFPAIHHISNEDAGTTKPAEEPVEKPTEDVTAKWSPGGYEPTRASWHTTRGKIKRFFA